MDLLDGVREESGDEKRTCQEGRRRTDSRNAPALLLAGMLTPLTRDEEGGRGGHPRSSGTGFLPMFPIMRALSIRQPWAELILRGIKTVEYRSRPTRIVGERFYIYAAKGVGREGWRVT